MNKEEIYQKAKLINKLEPGIKPALLIVDLVNGFTDPDKPLGSDLSTVIDNTNLLISSCRLKKIPIIFCTIAYNQNSLDGGLWVKKAPAQAEFTYNSDLIKIDNRLNYSPMEDIYMEKKYASSFFGTELASTLNASQIDTLIITGATTSGCVRATVVDSMQHGFIPIVVKEAVGDRAIEPHEASLFDIQAKYGEVYTLKQTVDYISLISM